jgi:hypothetical protein
MDNVVCRICGQSSKSNTEYSVKEMMFGFRDEFTYFECANCGCLQILKIPTDISKYYPSKYYSFIQEKPSFFMNIMIRKRNEYILFNEGILGR